MSKKKLRIESAVVGTFSPQQQQNQIHEVLINDISFNKNVRFTSTNEDDKNISSVDETDITELKESIKQYGLQAPITVYPSKDGNTPYICLIGHRRLMASRKLYEEDPSKNTIKSIIYDQPLTDEEIKLLQMTENIQRKNLSNAELVANVSELRNIGYSLEQIATKLNKSLPYIKQHSQASNVLHNIEEYEAKENIAEEEKIQKDVVIEQLGVQGVSQLASIKDPAEQRKIIKGIETDGKQKQDVKEEIKKAVKQAKSPTQSSHKEDKEDSGVKLYVNSQSLRITLVFNNQAELEKMANRMGKKYEILNESLMNKEG